MDFPYNTSYATHRYTVVSKGAGTVTLRLDAGSLGLFESYWKEFVSARIPGSEPPTGVSLKLVRLPREVQRIDAYSPLYIEYPQLLLVSGEKEVDISKYLMARKPDVQVPGLYKIEYRLNVPGLQDDPIWVSYVSIEEPPVLRHVVTPWNRDSYTIANLSRLALEPQFQEALYTAGSPLYNFVTSNIGPALNAYRARQCFQCTSSKYGGALFVTGPVLPLASELVLDAGAGDHFAVKLSRTVEAEEWTPRAYSKGAVVQRNSVAYRAEMGTTAADVPGACDTWVQGGYYSLQPSESWASAPEGGLETISVWAPVDLRGYIFQVDVRDAPTLGTYWGHYDIKYFKDYAPGDLVSYVSNGVLYIYRRNGTDIRDYSTEEAYRPGDYRNPHWEEAYAEWDGGELRNDGKWLRPMSNAGSAVISKTGSLSQQACTLWAHLLGIPDSIVDAIGGKCSVFLYVLLQRTRNTYDGLRYALQAMGLDVEGLHRVYPTVAYDDGEGHEYNDVYEAADALKLLAKAVKYDLVWQGAGEPPSLESVYPDEAVRTHILEEGLNWVRYAPSAPAPHTGRMYYEIQMLSGAAWKTVYRMTAFGDAQQYQDAEQRVRGNNRYYKGTLKLLERLATDAVTSIDGVDWVKKDSLPAVSQWASAAVEYEVPMYIYLVLTLHAIAEGHIGAYAHGMRRVHMAAVGGTPTLVVHPTKYFDLATMTAKELMATVQVQGYHGFWFDAQPDEEYQGSDIYRFNAAAAVRFQIEGHPVSRYWSSRFTQGLLGDSTGSVDAIAMPGGDPLYLINGMAAVTPMVDVSTITGEVLYLKYNYALDGSWALDGTTPFAGYASAGGTVACTWGGTMGEFVDAVAAVRDENGEALQYTLSLTGSQASLEVFGDIPQQIYIYGSTGNLLMTVTLPGELPQRAVGEDLAGAATIKALLSKET